MDNTVASLCTGRCALDLGTQGQMQTAGRLAAVAPASPGLQAATILLFLICLGLMIAYIPALRRRPLPRSSLSDDLRRRIQRARIVGGVAAALYLAGEALEEIWGWPVRHASYSAVFVALRPIGEVALAALVSWERLRRLGKLA